MTKRGLISHIEINVENLEKSSTFWGWFLHELGYLEYQNWNNGKSWILNSTYFIIVQVENEFKNSQYHRKKTGINHLAFHAENPHDVDKMADTLKKRGANILYQDRYPFAGGKASYAVYFEDPNRIKVEFVASVK